MNHAKETFIRLILDCNALTFGEFTLKSGRISPYFFNAGLIYKGAALKTLGKLYAHAIVDNKINFQHLFGPAYKGLPLATATAIALADLGVDTTVTFNRKEAKTHGEGGELIGAPLSGKTIIIDDVITAGTAFRQAQQLITANHGTITGVVIALNRCERGAGNLTTLDEIKAQGIQVISLITIYDLLAYLKAQKEEQLVTQLSLYLEKYASPE